MVKAGKIKAISKEIKSEVIAIRRHLHAHPELSFYEEQTAKFISSRLKEANIQFTNGIAGNGIVAMIHGKNPEKITVALRADMDALPITEKNEVDYKSENQGVMHACGHDVHSASLLGTAVILDALKSEFEGTVKLIFQPAEEKLPGGAALMIKEGALDSPRPDAIMAQHVFTQLPVGKVGFFPGKYMASSDEIYITVTGKGGHAAVPEGVINPLYIAAHLLVELEKLSVELSQASIPTILTFGKITGPGATNVVPDEVKLEGTLRTLDESWRRTVHDRLRDFTADFSSHSSGKTEIQILVGYPCLINDERVTYSFMQYAREYLGAENVKELSIWMASEDFAFYSQQIPACFYRLGTGNPEKNIVSPVHTPTFNIDEDALEISCGLMAWLAIKFLSGEQI